MLKTLAPYVKGFVRQSILTPICVIGEVLFDMLIPMLMARLVDQGIGTGSLGVIIKYGLLMILMAVLALTCGALGGKLGAEASTGLARNLRRGVFEHIQTFSFANIDHFSTAGLITRLTTDITMIQNAFQMVLRMLTRAPFSLIIAMTMSFLINAKLASIFLVAVVFLAIVIGCIMRKAAVYFKQMFERYDDLNESIQENLTGIRVVKAYVREDYESEKFHKATQKLFEFSLRAEKLMVIMMPFMTLTVYACIILLSWFGAREIVVGDMTTGQLMSILTYTMNIMISLMMVAMSSVMITMAAASGNRIAEVLKEESSLTDPAEAVKEVADGSVDFEDACFSYHGDLNNLHLSHVNLHIASGETIGILGGTGSAKTTLVQLIPRLYDVTSGCVKVGGRDVREYEIEALRDEVSMVLQKNVLFSGSIKENLRWGSKDASDEEIERVCRLACADEFIQQMPEGYDTHIEQGGSNVSGGQKQRLCIARALLKKPKILILDDSTSAVDTHTDAMIRKAFREEIPETTKLIIAQRISSVQDADRIVVINDGTINGIGTHEELMANNKIYQEVYYSQQKGGDQDGR